MSDTKGAASLINQSGKEIWIIICLSPGPWPPDTMKTQSAIVIHVSSLPYCTGCHPSSRSCRHCRLCSDMREFPPAPPDMGSAGWFGSVCEWRKYQSLQQAGVTGRKQGAMGQAHVCPMRGQPPMLREHSKRQMPHNKPQAQPLDTCTGKMCRVLPSQQNYHAQIHPQKNGLIYVLRIQYP
jgi:hypothetical protein